MDVSSIATAGIVAQQAQARTDISLAVLKQALTEDQQIANILSETIGNVTASRGNNVNISV